MTALRKWSTACVDWQDRIVKAQTLIPFAPLFHENQIEALQTFDALKMVDAGNDATFGDLCRPWIRHFVGHIFGAYENDTGIRHITEFFLLISKKNGKSTTAAAIMLTALILNWRDEAEFIILSPTVEVAQNSFKPAAAMVRADPILNDLLSVHDHVREIRHRETNAVLKVVAADSNTVAGKKAVGVLVDELWAFGKMANAEAMLMEATGGLASRPEGFIIYLTTQSDDPPAGVFKSKLEYARNVRDGIVDDPQFLAVIYEFPPDMIKAKQHLLPQNFYITNPNLTVADKPELGGSVNVHFIEREYRKAQVEGPEKMRIFLAKHLNVEIGMNLRADAWPGAEHWEEAACLELVTLDYLIEHCEVITGGIDGGGLDDLLGAAFIGRKKRPEWVTIPEHRDEDTGEIVPARPILLRRWVAWMHGYANPSVLKRRKDISSKLRDFAKEGTVTLCSYVGQDTDKLANCVKKIDDSGLLFQVGLDPSAIGGVLDAILLTGVDSAKLVKVNQGFRLAASIKTIERKLAERVLVTDGNAAAKWYVGNAKVVVKGNSIVITKQVSGTAKIDPLIALFNAGELMALNPEAQNDSFDVSQMVIAG